MTVLVSLIKKGIAYVLAAIFSFLSPVIGDINTENKVKDEETVRLNFAAVSDVHIENDLLRKGLFALGLEDMKNSGASFDALIMCGDNTNHGYRTEYKAIEELFGEYTPAKQIFIATGNHDTWTREEAGDNYPEIFCEYANKFSGLEIEKPYYSVKINGYSFIFLASEKDNTGAYFSPEQLNWLRAEMDKASESGLPVFVITHWPFNGTHGLPYAFGYDKDADPDDGGMGDQSDEVEAILKAYKNVFMLSGHVHNGLTNDLTDDICGFSTVENDGSFHSVNLPSYNLAFTKGNIFNGMGFQVEVYEKEVVFRARNFALGMFYPDYDFTFELV